MMKIVLFEDSGFENLYPLTYLRPVFELRCGAFTLRERIGRKFPEATLYVETREALRELATESYGESRANNPNALRPDDDILLVNAGAILTCPTESYPGQDRVALNADGELVWAFLKKETVAGMQAGSAAELAHAALMHYRGHPRAVPLGPHRRERGTDCTRLPGLLPARSEQPTDEGRRDSR